MAEFNVLDANGATIPRTGWSVVADSQETVGENGAAVNALDGSAKTFWHTQWFASNPQPPHTFTVDMGQPQNVRGFKYLPRADGNTNGMIANWRFWTSTDGVTWSLVTQGTFVKSSAEKTVTLP
jgi:galactose oxidase